jgi:hypothetical protein
VVPRNKKVGAIVTGRFFIGAILLLALVYPGTAAALALSDLTLVYDANFDDGTLNPSVDSLGIGAMQIGDTLIPGSNPSAVIENGGVTLSITRPSGAPPGPVDVGLVATPVSFGLGSIVGIRAVYELPIGPHDAGTQWALGLVARTGPVDDLPAALRATATFTVAGNVARLNTPFASTPAGLPTVPQSVYDAIFSGDDPATLTLELIVDRTTGLAYASLTSDSYFISRSNFTYANFGANFGPTITAVQPTIAISSGSDVTASVRVLDFQVFEAPEPATWALFCSGLFVLGMGKRRFQSADRKT